MDSTINFIIIENKIK